MSVFHLKSEAYSHLLVLLQQAQYKDNQSVQAAIIAIRRLFENHEQDVSKVLDLLTPILKDETLPDYFKNELYSFQEFIKNKTFSTDNVKARFENPVRRQLDSLMAISLLQEPTSKMMESVNEISKKIIIVLRNYKENGSNPDKFLKSLKNLGGDNDYNAAITCGSFDHQPDLDEVIDFLEKADHTQLAEVMHIHFKFSLIVSRLVDLPYAGSNEPVGKFREIIEELEPEGYESYFKKISTGGKERQEYRQKLSNDVIYSSPLYKADPEKGRSGMPDYKVKTKTLGLMTKSQQSYESTFPSKELPWVADAKAVTPNFKSRVTRDAIDNDAIYVSGPSGIASLLLHIMENMGNFQTIEQKQSYLAAICGYIAGSGFHSIHEVLAPAAFCLDLVPEYDVDVADVKGGKKGSAPKFNKFYEALYFDGEFKKKHESVWENFYQLQEAQANKITMATKKLCHSFQSRLQIKISDAIGRLPDEVFSDEKPRSQYYAVSSDGNIDTKNYDFDKLISDRIPFSEELYDDIMRYNSVCEMSSILSDKNTTSASKLFNLKMKVADDKTKAIFKKDNDLLPVRFLKKIVNTLASKISGSDLPFWQANSGDMFSCKLKHNLQSTRFGA